MKEKIIKGALILSVAPFITQLFSFLILPFITRLYPPEYLGIYTTVVSISGLIAIFQGLGYHQAVILPKDNSIAELIYNFCLSTTFVLSILYLVLVLLVPESIIVNYVSSSVIEYKFSVLFIILFDGLYRCLLSMNIRKGNYKIISLSRVLRAFTNKFTVLFLAIVFISSPSNLIIAEILSSLIVCCTLYFGINKLFFTKNINYNILKDVLIRYKQFPKFDLPSNVLFRSKQAIIIILLLKFYSAEIVGYFGMALLILTIPTTLIGSAVSEVFYKEASTYKSPEKLKKSTLDLFFTLLSTSLVIFTLLALFSKSLIPFFLGNDWASASGVIAVLVIVSFSDFMISPFLNIFKILNKQHFSFMYQATSLILSILAICYGAEFDNYTFSFLFYSIVNFLIATILIIILFKLIRIKFSSLINILKIFLNLIPVLIIYAFYIYVFNNSNIYFDILIIVFSFLLNYLLNYKSIPAFRFFLNYLLINPLYKLWQKK